MAQRSILILTKNTGIDLLLKQIPAKYNYDIHTVHNMHEIQSSYNVYRPSLIIVDLNFCDMDGVLLLEYLMNIQCTSPIILIGTQEERLLLAIKHIGESKGLSIIGALNKPLQQDKLERLMRAFEQHLVNYIDASKIALALEENEFDVYYQPKIQVKSKKICGLEGLVRWRKPDGELITPMEFIPIAEDSGLIAPLTHWVIKRVFQDCSKFNSEKKQATFSINLSPKILSDITLPDLIHSLAREYNIDPQNICFEITESGVSHQSETILEVLTRLRITGFSLSIDDFGTGYSSIAELHRLPFNELKIDRSFVIDLNQNHSSQTIVHSTIELGHRLGLLLVAEGVETPEALEMLELLECDICQGFLISKPLSLQNLHDWYALNIDSDLTWRG